MNELIQMTAPSAIALFNTTKAERQSFIDNLMTELESGNVDPLKIHYEIKCIEKILDGLTNTDETKNRANFLNAKKYKEFVLDAAKKYGQKKFDFSNSIVEIKEMGTKYDWSKCGDEKLLQDMAQLTELADKIKNRQELLKLIPEKGLTEVDTDSGETITVYPPAKSSTTGVQITLK